MRDGLRLPTGRGPEWSASGRQPAPGTGRAMIDAAERNRGLPRPGRLACRRQRSPEQPADWNRSAVSRPRVGDMCFSRRHDGF
ncbi:hypothetical protein UA74_10260 [Actinoalloteichus fjordicus]|uniref:Uncharacterized protein n=1 Tax=Actinoalloteichus fjordicus TaxID=1612552 RepID=A0AAC9LC37_9PSEU|nr:hypothetical protein UA74_10260 [Actinoalloteichus fjordicus]